MHFSNWTLFTQKAGTVQRRESKVLRVGPSHLFRHANHVRGEGVADQRQAHEAVADPLQVADRRRRRRWWCQGQGIASPKAAAAAATPAAATTAAATTETTAAASDPGADHAAPDVHGQVPREAPGQGTLGHQAHQKAGRRNGSVGQV